MRGVLLINLGTPDNLELTSVKKYLKEFLSDSYVVDIPSIIRKILVNFIIVPFRSRKTQEAYQSIWTKKGSPLIINTNLIKERLDQKIEYPVEMAMRYQNPSIEKGLISLKEKGCKDIIVLPLYPHYAEATSLTTKLKVREVRDALDLDINLQFLNEFYKEEGYIDSLSKQINTYLKNDIDFLLFSYHGIPKRQNIRTNPTYEEQVKLASKLCAEKLNLKDDQWGVAFQSRLGPGWLQPFTDKMLENLPKNGKRKIAVVCPSFVADNLETLEEINIEARETFIESGGHEFIFIPCLNNDDKWIDFLVDYISN
tara:strand:+ start:1187 stop:2122 length:936 start_codon:yes stop_codon:yes gene_type:complete